MMTAEPADIALLARVLNGDESGLAVLLDRYWHSLVRYSWSILDDQDAAEDVTQEVFVRLWEHRDTWGLEGSVLGLLFRMTRNLSLDEQRQRDARRRAANKAPDQHTEPSPTDSTHTQELASAIEKAVATLPQRRREVFILIRQHGLSYREAAEALGLAPQTVANHLNMAVTDLREALKAFLPDQPEKPSWRDSLAAVRDVRGAFGQ
jgi:RNA polymerase sigma-70 factor (ECF subfamily)